MSPKGFRQKGGGKGIRSLDPNANFAGLGIKMLLLLMMMIMMIVIMMMLMMMMMMMMMMIMMLLLLLMMINASTPKGPCSSQLC